MNVRWIENGMHTIEMCTNIERHFQIFVVVYQMTFGTYRFVDSKELFIMFSKQNSFRAYCFCNSIEIRSALDWVYIEMLRHYSIAHFRFWTLVISPLLNTLNYSIKGSTDELHKLSHENSISSQMKTTLKHFVFESYANDKHCFI